MQTLRPLTKCHVKDHINSLKKQGERLSDVKGTTIAIRLQEFDGHFLSVVSGGVDLATQMLDL